MSRAYHYWKRTKSYRSQINCNYFKNVVNLSINVCNSFNYRHLNKFNSSRVINLSRTICNFFNYEHPYKFKCLVAIICQQKKVNILTFSTLTNPTIQFVNMCKHLFQLSALLNPNIEEHSICQQMQLTLSTTSTLTSLTLQGQSIYKQMYVTPSTTNTLTNPTFQGQSI